jgi:hypothetical protein
MPTKHLAVPYLSVGKHIRVERPSNEPEVAVGGSATVKDDAVGQVLHGSKTSAPVLKAARLRTA